MALDDALDLQQAADALGVHYQTAYRWVRTGRLPAHRVAGRYVVARSDAQRLMAEREQPAPPPAPSARRLERQAAQVHTALVEGDEATVRRVARRLTEEGTSIIELIEDVIAPPLAWIGQEWHDGKITVWVEHRASAIAERVLGELAPNPRGRRRGTAMVAAVTGDRHSLPTTMAALALRSANWHVHHLGADMPPAELVRFCAEHEVDLAVISFTNPDAAPAAREAVEGLTAQGVPVLLGAPGQTLQQLVDDARRVTAG